MTGSRTATLRTARPGVIALVAPSLLHPVKEVQAPHLTSDSG